MVTGDGIALASIEGGEPKPVQNTRPGEVPLRWAKGRDALFVGQRGEASCSIVMVDLTTGAKTPWKAVAPPDIAGVVGVSCPRIAADEQHYIFGYTRNLSDLFLVEHFK